MSPYSEFNSPYDNANILNLPKNPHIRFSHGRDKVPLHWSIFSDINQNTWNTQTYFLLNKLHQFNKQKLFARVVNQLIIMTGSWPKYSSSQSKRQHAMSLLFGFPVDLPISPTPSGRAALWNCVFLSCRPREPNQWRMRFTMNRKRCAATLWLLR